MNRNGRLIVLEGGEGGGKSTHARHVAAWLKRRGRRVVVTREPGGSPLAERIRELVLARGRDAPSALTELLLMFAARAAHLHATILPAINAGKDVVCDRFVDATYAYQGAGRGVPRAVIDRLAGLVLGSFRPALVLVLDLDPAVGMRRVRSRGVANRFDDEALAFQRRVRREYLRRARAAPRRYAVVDAARPVGEVWSAIERVLEARL